jgi:hypothetical protein
MTNTTNHAPAGIDLDKLAAIADRLEGRFQYSTSDELREMIALARRAAPDAPAADEIAQLRAQNALLLGLCDAAGKLVKAKGRYHTEQNYGALVAAYDLAKPVSKPIAHPIGQVSPAIEQAPVYACKCGHSLNVCIATSCPHSKLEVSNSGAPISAVSPSGATGNAEMCLLCTKNGGHCWRHKTGKAVAASAGGLSTLPEPENYQAIIDAAEGDGEHGATSAADAKTADCHESCGYVGAECDFPHCKSNGAADAMDAAEKKLEANHALENLADVAHAHGKDRAWITEHLAAVRDAFPRADIELKAARYNYLRETTKAIRNDEGTERIECTPEQFDEAIDSAIAASRNGGK